MKDIILNNDNDLVFSAGDLTTDISDFQHQQLLITNSKGAFKEFPLTGVDAFEYLQDATTDELRREISRQFTMDGMRVNKIDVTTDGQLKIDATYANS